MILPLMLILAQAGSSDGGVSTESPRPRLVLLDPELRGASVIEGAAVASSVAASARELDAFEVTTSNDIRTMMSLERQRQLFAVNAEMTTITDALGARHAVAMWVAKLGKDFQAELRLVDTRSGAVLAQKQTARLATVAEAASAAGSLTHEVLGPLLKDQQGKLIVRVSEEAAEVRIDDVIVGASPLTDTLMVSRGRHRLDVRKDGFIAQVRTIAVSPVGTGVEEVRLVPSPDYVGAYHQRNTRMRIGAWLSTGLAAGLIVAGVLVDRLGTDPLYQQQFLPRARVLQGLTLDPLNEQQRQVATACSADVNTCFEDASHARVQLQTLQGLTYGLLGGAALAAGFATYFWVASDDPNRYARLAFVPTASGFSFALSGGF